MRQVLTVALILAASTALAVTGGHFDGVGGQANHDVSRAVVWSQMPQPAPSYYFASHYDATGAWYAESADDFFFESVDPITKVEWWGRYVEPSPPPYATSFIIRFYEDVPAGDPPYSHPGDVLYTGTVDMFTEEPAPEVGSAVFHYEAELMTHAFLPAGHIYWISIQAGVFEDPDQWGWVKCVTEDEYMDEAVMISTPFGLPMWTPMSQLPRTPPFPHSELAFVLHSEPGTPVEDATWGGIKAMFR